MNLDERIRERAYQLWEAEGKPEGQDFDLWLRARDEIETAPDEIETAPEEGDVPAGGVESSVAIPMPKSSVGH